MITTTTAEQLGRRGFARVIRMHGLSMQAHARNLDTRLGRSARSSIVRVGSVTVYPRDRELALRAEAAELEAIALGLDADAIERVAL